MLDTRSKGNTANWVGPLDRIFFENNVGFSEAENIASLNILFSPFEAKGSNTVCSLFVPNNPEQFITLQLTLLHLLVLLLPICLRVANTISTLLHRSPRNSNEQQTSIHVGRQRNERIQEATHRRDRRQCSLQTCDGGCCRSTSTTSDVSDECLQPSGEGHRQR